MPFDRVEDAIQDIRDGRMVIVADDEDRENEGDLVCAAARITPEIVNFMATHGRGMICVPLMAERTDALNLPPMAEQNQDARGTASERAQATQAAIATALITAAERIEGLAKKLGQTGESGPSVAQG